MRVISNETIVVRPEQIRLVRRENTNKWQVHYKLDGVKTWFRKSVQTTDVDKAVELAERLWMKATFDHEEGRPVISKKYKPVAEVVLRRLEEEIKAELDEHLPLLATSKILMECVKAGMGREAAHQLIKKHSTSSTASNFFTALASEKDFPLSINQLNALIENPAVFAGLATDQSKTVLQMINKATLGKISKVELPHLR